LPGGPEAGCLDLGVLQRGQGMPAAPEGCVLLQCAVGRLLDVTAAPGSSAMQTAAPSTCVVTKTQMTRAENATLARSNIGLIYEETARRGNQLCPVNFMAAKLLLHVLLSASCTGLLHPESLRKQACWLLVCSAQIWPRRRPGRCSGPASNVDVIPYVHVYMPTQQAISLGCANVQA
jgi:hypothetical protein